MMHSLSNFVVRCDVALLMLVAVAVAAPARAAEVVLHRLDGTHVRGVWAGGEESLVKIAATGGPVDMPLVDVAEVRVVRGEGGSAAPAAESDQAVFHLADGGALFGRIAASTPSGVTAATRFSSETNLPFAQLSAIRFEADTTTYAKAAELFAAAMADRLPGQDVLITREEQDVRSLRGAVTALRPDSGTFTIGGRERTFELTKVFGVVFAREAGTTPTAPALLQLADGTTVGGRFLGGDASSVRIAAGFGAEIHAAIDTIESIRFRSDRVVFVSELKPLREAVEGRLHPTRPPQRDRGVTGGPLAAGGRTFSRGLGVCARTTVEYELNGEFETFAAAVGVDDRVGSAGSVVFRVLGDGRVLGETGTLTGDDDLVELALPVKDVRVLTLLVDFADELDLGDQAVWGQARLIRPAGQGAP